MEKAVTKQSAESKFDGIIFDLDGTLWDSVRSVVVVWNNALKSAGIEPTMTYEQLSRYMGLRIEQIFDNVLPHATDEQRTKIIESCTIDERHYLAEHGGILYDNEEEVLRQLKQNHSMFIVSNCQDGYIQGFYEAHGLEKYFDDYECAGRTGLPKGDNIKLVVQRNHLQKPVYIGDTISDYAAARAAGVPFIFAEYGFGEVENPDYTAKTFEDIIRIVED